MKLTRLESSVRPRRAAILPAKIVVKVVTTHTLHVYNSSSRVIWRSAFGGHTLRMISERSLTGQDMPFEDLAPRRTYAQRAKRVVVTTIILGMDLGTTTVSLRRGGDAREAGARCPMTGRGRQQSSGAGACHLEVGGRPDHACGCRGSGLLLGGRAHAADAQLHTRHTSNNSTRCACRR